MYYSVCRYRNFRRAIRFNMKVASPIIALMLTQVACGKVRNKREFRVIHPRKAGVAQVELPRNSSPPENSLFPRPKLSTEPKITFDK